MEILVSGISKTTKFGRKKMKKYHVAFLTGLILLSLSSHCKSETIPGLEMLVLCSNEASVMEIKQKIENKDGFILAGGNFYQPVATTQAFGFNVAYVGLSGVDMVPGPNLTVKGRYEDVEKKVKDTHHGTFNCGPGGCDSQVDKYLHVMIYPHPADTELTIIQCGYFGP